MTNMVEAMQFSLSGSVILIGLVAFFFFLEKPPLISKTLNKTKKG